MPIVDDRLLARCALEAVGWNAGAAPKAMADIAVGDALTTLRIRGVAIGPEILRTVRDDVDLILADPDRLARAKVMAASAARRRAAESAALPELRRVG